MFVYSTEFNFCLIKINKSTFFLQNGDLLEKMECVKKLLLIKKKKVLLNFRKFLKQKQAIIGKKELIFKWPKQKINTFYLI